MPNRSNRTRLALALCVGLLVRVASPAAEVVPERRLKAAFVSKFPQFVEWPRASLDGRASIDVCVANPDPFGADLVELLAGEAVNGRALAVRPVSSPSDVPGCHLLFVSERSGARRLLLRAAGTLPILTVGDDPHFLDDGGIVGLRVIDGRVRFEIDDGAARRVGLRISSQLLRLALAVRGGAA